MTYTPRFLLFSSNFTARDCVLFEGQPQILISVCATSVRFEVIDDLYQQNQFLRREHYTLMTSSSSFLMSKIDTRVCSKQHQNSYQNTFWERSSGKKIGRLALTMVMDYTTKHIINCSLFKLRAKRHFLKICVCQHSFPLSSIALWPLLNNKRKVPSLDQNYTQLKLITCKTQSWS